MAAQPAPVLDRNELVLADVLSRVLDRGAVAAGDVVISVAGIDLIQLGARLFLGSVESARSAERAGSPARRVPPPAPRRTGLAVDDACATEGARTEAPGALPALSVPPPRPHDDSARSGVVDGGRGVELAPLRMPDPAGGDDIDAGLARLVLTVVELLRRVLEHQAVRRMEGGGLTDEEVERLGIALLRLEQRLGDIRRVFGLREEDLQLDLGPLGRLV